MPFTMTAPVTNEKKAELIQWFPDRALETFPMFELNELPLHMDDLDPEIV